MNQGVDTVVLYDELACYEVLPLHWQPLAQPPDPTELMRLDESNLLLLQACVAFEDHLVRENHEDIGPLVGELARMDFKLNLVLRLLGSLIDGGRFPVPVQIRYNSMGAAWPAIGAVPPSGSRGMLGIRLLSSLPMSLDVYAEVASGEGGTVTARFVELKPAVAELIRRVCFLRHRKQVAGARKSRNS